MTPGDDAAGEMKQAEVVSRLLAPADQDGTEAVQPGVGPLHHPASGLGLGVTLGRDLLAAGAQVQGEAELLGQGTWLVIVVAFVKAEILRLIRRRLWPLNRDRLDGLAHEFVVVAVGAVDHRRQWHATA